MADLTTNKVLLDKVVPQDQSFQNNYYGNVSVTLACIDTELKRNLMVTKSRFLVILLYIYKKKQKNTEGEPEER